MRIFFAGHHFRDWFEGKPKGHRPIESIRRGAYLQSTPISHKGVSQSGWFYRERKTGPTNGDMGGHELEFGPKFFDPKFGSPRDLTTGQDVSIDPL